MHTNNLQLKESGHCWWTWRNGQFLILLKGIKGRKCISIGQGRKVLDPWTLLDSLADF